MQTDPLEQDFKVKFVARLFDCGAQQGLAVSVGPNRHAIGISYKSSPAEVAEKLRGLADWIASQAGGD